MLLQVAPHLRRCTGLNVVSDLLDAPPSEFLQAFIKQPLFILSPRILDLLGAVMMAMLASHTTAHSSFIILFFAIYMTLLSVLEASHASRGCQSFLKATRIGAWWPAPRYICLEFLCLLLFFLFRILFNKLLSLFYQTPICLHIANHVMGTS